MFHGIDFASPREDSIFHTSRPRDTKARVHLLLVLLTVVSSITIAILITKGSELSILSVETTPLNSDD